MKNVIDQEKCYNNCFWFLLYYSFTATYQQYPSYTDHDLRFAHETVDHIQYSNEEFHSGGNT